MLSASRTAMAMVFSALVCGGMSGARAVDIATVAKTGDVAPGTGGATFGTIGPAALNGAGELAFGASLTGSGVTPGVNDRGVWVGKSGGLILAVRRGDPAPGTGGATFSGIGRPTLNGASELAFGGSLTGSGVTPGTNDLGIWAGKPGRLTLAARRGDPAPGTSGAVYDEFPSFPLLNGAGELAFRAKLTGSGVTQFVNDAGIWAGKPGALSLVARSGDPAPGTNGAVFRSLAVVFPKLNGAGELVFEAGITGDGVTPNVNDEGIWAGKPGALALVARAGDPAPGTGGAVFDSFSGPVLNGAGELAFDARFTGGVTSGEGIWVGAPGAFELVVRAGDPAPGAGGAAFASFFPPELNDAGDVAFLGRLRQGGPFPTRTDEGIWAGRPGALALVAREGFTVPFNSFFTPTLNGLGEVAFQEFDTVGPMMRNSRIWAGASGRLQRIAGPGDAIRVARRDFRTVADGGVGLSGFSEGGQAAFRAVFTDSSSGVFLSPPDAPKVHRMPYRAISGSWDQVMLPQSFSKPVIIASPPSLADKAPGAVRLRAIDGARGRFEGRFQEWRYLDGRHTEERMDFLVLEQGRHRQADGSLWEAGTVKVKGNRRWKHRRFKRRFRKPPKVFATLQSFRGRTPVVARVRNVTRTGFEISIQEEEEDLAGRHTKETVGYLAVFSRRGRGTIAGGVDGSKYRLRQAQVNHRFGKVLRERLKLEEEKSKDKEVKHKKETVSVMSLGRSLFAQQASDKEPDTTALRRR